MSGHALKFNTWAKIATAEKCKALQAVCEKLALRWQKPARYYWVGFIEGTTVKVEYWPSTGKWRHLQIVHTGTPKQFAEYLDDMVRAEADMERRKWLRDVH